MENIEIARVLRETADLLEIQAANPFRIRAYRNAVRTIEAQTVPMRKLVEEGANLTELPAIGKGMAENIEEIIRTGVLGVLSELSEQIPEGLIDLVKLPGLGSKKARKLWEELGIESIEDLEKAAAEGRISELVGFGMKTEERILEEIENFRTNISRFRIGEVDDLLSPLLEHMRAVSGVQRIEVAGSYRRRCETIGDIDLLALASDPVKVSEGLVGFSGVDRVLGSGLAKTSVMLRSGLQVDLRVVPTDSWGAALIYFTGSKEHNIKLRQRALERQLRVSEYGIFEIPDESLSDTIGERGLASEGKMVAGDSEESVYEALGLPWLPPEMREDRGELTVADANQLPNLIEQSDLKGDVHMHSTWSDGRDSLEEMVQACKSRGYEYMAITDHSKALAMVKGLDAEKLSRQWVEIDEVQSRHQGIRILKGMEVDILRDGSLDLEDELLDRLDIVIVSIHSHFRLERSEQTERVLKALSHPRAMIFGHPTGRIINRRSPIEIDIEEILQACAEFSVAVELNSNPNRLDLRDTHLWRARELNIPVLITTDAHRTEGLALAHYGVEQARRAWLTSQHVLNTCSIDDFLARIG